MLLTRSTTGIVIADDSDPTRISYQGSWYTSSDAEVLFNSTAHTTQTLGSTATFTFTGISVAVYGTITGTTGQYRPPRSTYSIDDGSPTTFIPSTVAEKDLHQQLFYQSPTLPDGEHRLVVTHIGNSSRLWLDYFLYLRLPPVLPPLSPPKTPAAPGTLNIRDSGNNLTPFTDGAIVIDDSNSSYVFYRGDWRTGGETVEYNHTTHGSYTAGSTATLLFNGTSVAVYGTLYGPTQIPPISTYTVDGTTPFIYTAPPTNVSLFQTLFYQSATLQDGHHTLVVNLTNENSQMWLDYFVYMPSPSSSSPPSGPKRVNIGAIAGGTTAGVILLVFCFFFGLRIHKNRAAQKLKDDKLPTVEQPKDEPAKGLLRPGIFPHADNVNVAGSTMNEVTGTQQNISYYAPVHFHSGNSGEALQGSS